MARTIVKLQSGPNRAPPLVPPSGELPKDEATEVRTWVRLLKLVFGNARRAEAVAVILLSETCCQLCATYSQVLYTIERILN